MVLCALLMAPAPAWAVLGPAEQAFPETRSGEQSAARTITYATGRLREEPPEPVAAVAIAGPDAAAFTVVDDRCSGRDVSSACVVTVAFSPARVGEARAELAVQGADATARTALTGAGFVTGPRLVPSETVLRFPSVPHGQISPRVTLTVENEGDRPVTITATAIRGPGASDFVTGEESCAGARLEPGERCTIKLAYAPSAFTPGGDAALEVRTADRVERIELQGVVVVRALAQRAVRAAAVVPPSCSGSVRLQGARVRGRVLLVTVFALCRAPFSVEAKPLGPRGRLKRTRPLVVTTPGRAQTFRATKLNGGHRVRVRSAGRLSPSKTVR